MTKKYPTGDGMFFAWVMSAAILITGMIVQAVECYTEQEDGTTRCPQFEPFAMLGGAVWATGNVLTVPIIKTLGLGMGICVWGSVNMIVGWAQGHFGLFGLHADVISSPGLNYAGVALTVCAIVCFLFIKPTLDAPGGKRRSGKGGDVEDEQGVDLLGEEDGEDGEGGEGGANAEASFLDRLPEGAKRIFGITLSVVAGSCYGLNFT